ncbi:MAG: ubiquinol-cytochrome c reductase iron-sulfur subunit [Candidatus Eutrophobiaceae bacterium]
MPDGDKPIELGRRRFLTAAATVVGGAGVVAGALPFAATWIPSARTRAVGAPVEVDISRLQLGERMIVEWRGKPVWILRRDDAMLQSLDTLSESLKDPKSTGQNQPSYANNLSRSVKPEYFVVVGICTHLGCSPLYETKDTVRKLGDDWKGGFFCPCHQSRFDLAGRVYKGSPASSNMIVPPHQYLGNGRIMIGDDSSV